MVPNMTVMVYGANGYVGGLLAQAAAGDGVDVIAAGRSSAIERWAQTHDLTCRVGGVTDIDLDGIEVVLNAAGPFATTARQLAEHCIDHGVHYVDIAGEASEFVEIHRLVERAAIAGSMLMPGVGFGVVPTDCLALHLVEQLPDASQIDIAFATIGGVSGGTLRTMTGGFGDRGAVTSSNLEHRTFDFADKSRRCVQNPWRGDLFTAPITTGIDTISTWIALPRPVDAALVSAHRRGNQDRPPFLARLIRSIAERAPAGPSAKKRAKGRAEIWAQVSNPSGERVAATLSTPDAYVHTVDAAIAVVNRIAAGDAEPGFWTPAGRYGADFVLELPGVTRISR